MDETMRKPTEIGKKAAKPSKERVEKVARRLCEQAGMNPDDMDVWEGEYGYKNYHFPKWQRFATEAKKRIAKGEADA
jgi:hypothetical protein